MSADSIIFLLSLLLLPSSASPSFFSSDLGSTSKIVSLSVGIEVGGCEESDDETLKF